MQLEKLATYCGKKGPLLLVVADGVGIAPDGPANAVSLAKTPVMDVLLASPHATALNAHGAWVGLPSDDDMGNSEVGHNALGSGQIINQGAKLVNQAFSDGSIFESATWQNVEQRAASGASVHFLGLLSDGNIHSHIDHLINLIRRCDQQNIKTVRIHCLLDGRDVEPRSAIGFVEQLEVILSSINTNDQRDYRIASGGGRMRITMDRYEADWQMVHRGYQCHVKGQGIAATSVVEEITRQYAANAELDDQYLDAFVIVDQQQRPIGTVEDGDAMVLFNFRGDRAIEISLAMQQAEFSHFRRENHPEVFYAGMLEYDGDLKLPASYLVNPPVIQHTMIKYMCAERLRTFAVSETQKFGHVTYFWNGNRSEPFDADLETWVEIPSDNVPFNQAPEMKAGEITERTIELLRSGEFAFGRINFANGDMVGHTGDVAATVRSLEVVDQCLGRLVDVIRELDGTMVYTADHGNAEEMFVEKNGQRIARTSHTLNQVPFVIVENGDQTAWHLAQDGSSNGGLANVAATVFNLMGYRAPAGYQPSLVNIPDEPRSRRVIHEGVVVNLGLETVKLPNGEILALEIVRHHGGAVVIALNDKREVCLIKQFRHAANGWIWELPAGMLELGEQPKIAAMRELKEETGCTTNELVSLGSTLSTPGFCTERLYIFLAEHVEQGEAEPEQCEFIETHWVELNRALEMAMNGEIDDAKTIVGLFRLQHFLANQT